MKRFPWGWPLAWMLALGCGHGTSATFDAGATPDAGIDSDAGAPLDAGQTPDAAVADYIVTVDLAAGSPLHAHFSGANMEWPGNGNVWGDEANPNGLTAALTGATPGGNIPNLELGWLRFPGGATSQGYNWRTGQLASDAGPTYPFDAAGTFTCFDGGIVIPAGSSDWVREMVCGSSPSSRLVTLLPAVQQINMGKVGHSDFGGGFDGGFTAFAAAANVAAVIELNTYTDPGGADIAPLVCPGQGHPLTDVTFEFDNEAYLYQQFWRTKYGCSGGPAAAAACYAKGTLPLAQGIVNGTCPGSNVTLYYEGWYQVPGTGAGNGLSQWDTALAALAADAGIEGASVHIYPINSGLPGCSSGCSAETAVTYLDDVLLNGTTTFVDAFRTLSALSNPRIVISELQVGGQEGALDPSAAIRGTVYESLFLAEYTARMSSSAYVERVGVQQVAANNTDCAQGTCVTPTPYDVGESFVLNSEDPQMRAATTAATTCTSDDPACLVNSAGYDFGYQATVMGSGMTVVNGAINHSDTVYATSVAPGTGSPATAPWASVNGKGQPSGTMPAVYGQGYSLGGGQKYLVLINKSAQAQQVQVSTSSGPLSTYTLVSFCDATEGTPAPSDSAWTYSPGVSGTANPVVLGPYCIARIEYQ
jgi:hypothetical protein